MIGEIGRNMYDCPQQRAASNNGFLVLQRSDLRQERGAAHHRVVRQHFRGDQVGGQLRPGRHRHRQLEAVLAVHSARDREPAQATVSAAALVERSKSMQA